MNTIDFENLIAAYGADPAAWPSAKAQTAQAFMKKFPEQAKIVMARETQLDAALNLISAPAPSDLLKKRIQNAATPAVANENTPAPQSGLLRWRSAAALMLGAFALGFGGANWMPNGEETSEVLYAQTDTDWQDAADDLGLLDTYSWVEEDTTN